jgi:hypothetical protein
MSNQEIVATAEKQDESSSLFDELACLVPEERLTEYYRVIAHTRTLSPNDEMLRILEAMGVLALLTREAPARDRLRAQGAPEDSGTSATQASAVERRMEQYAARLESRLAQLPKELESGLDPPRIAKLLGESLRQSFQRSGLPDTAKTLGQSCFEMNSAQKQLVNVLREVAHPDVGVVARIRSANDSLLRSMTTRAQQMDDVLARLEKQVWAIWLPIVAGAALALGFVLGTWFGNVRQSPPETTSGIQFQQRPAIQDEQSKAAHQQQLKHR